MKKPLEIVMIAAAVLVVASLAGLAITGLKPVRDVYNILHRGSGFFNICSS